MNIPKVNIKIMSLEENIELVEWSYFENGEVLNLHECTINLFPQLRSIDSKLNKEQIKEKIKEVVSKYYIDNQEKLNSEAIRYKKIWDKYNDSYMIAISKYLNIEWPVKMENIDCTVGVIPVCPRNINKFNFSLDINRIESRIIEAIAHECLHFIWFEKWKNLFPECCEEEFNSPHISWEYSEIVPYLILNSKEINDILNVKCNIYSYFFEMKDNDKLVIEKLKEIFKDDKNIDDKIIDGYNYIFEYRTKSIKTK